MAEISAATNNRKRIWGWWFFDWASQPYHTLLVTFVFGPFFAAVATEHFLGLGLEDEAAKARAQAMWSTSMTLIGLTIGLLAPLIGAIADQSGRRRPWISVFSIAYMIGAFGLWYTDPSGSNLVWVLISFAIGFIGAEFAGIFINAQLPNLGSKDEVGDISGSGFAFGYLGGVVALALMLAFFVEQGTGKTIAEFDPAFGLEAATKEGTRAVGPFTALWFAVFMVPYFLWVRDRNVRGRGGDIAGALRQVLNSIKALGQRLSLAFFLGASMLYRDALNGLYMFGGVYAKLVLDWELTQIGVFGILGATSAALCCWLGGKADRAFGPKPVIIASILVLTAVCIVVVNMSREAIFGVPLAEGSDLPDQLFMACGALIGGFGGVLQAASRSLMVRHTTPENATEAFGLYGLSGRATAFLAPALIGLVTTLTENARIGISPVIALFLAGLLLLKWVDSQGDQR
ncbi:Vacuole effluxer Atg22 like protein [Tritonibacter multivorans]|uniref:Vacuole effluxer Atg22 like protein n=1 Tax=Tritonibacter multivorans TaxID=928856 RepID=A0A0P1GV79_9RHOB|nr:MFS transporter [Tritonibacter multivorans]MDA7420235.1 MFS transporter [Tritonibacter multivorans]CUH79958.1 Vacuole effluxer Atg22 like protein [Tritonibacter multivorans]SFB98919.1 MFS transporter, UMF1 family [Tritonibacter multivorans]